MKVIVAMEYYGDYEGEGLFGVFMSVDEIMRALKKVYSGEYFKDFEFEHRPGSETIVMIRVRNLSTAGHKYRYKEVVSTWNLYTVEVDQAVCL